MGSRSRIRWHKVFKLGVGVLGFLALFLGLPSLIRRPEPPPLEPDIGLVHVGASREPAPSGRRPGPGRRAATGRDRPGGQACRPAGALTRRKRSRRRGFRRSCSGTRSEDQGRLVAARRPTNREGVPPSTGSPATDAPAPAPAPVPVPAADTAPPPAPPALPPTAPPPARAAAPQPTAPTEFGFER
jgi:hypothetical protein